MYILRGHTFDDDDKLRIYAIVRYVRFDKRLVFRDLAARMK